MAREALAGDRSRGHAELRLGPESRMESSEADDRVVAEKKRRRALEIAVLLTVISPFVAEIVGFPNLGPYAFALCLAGVVLLLVEGQITNLSQRIDRR